MEDTNLNNLSNRSMLTTLEISSWSGRCIDKDISADIINQNMAQKDAGAFTKRLVNKDALKEISTISNEARKMHKQLTLSWTDKKARLIPMSLVNEHLTLMREFQNKQEQAVDNFIINYNDCIEEAKGILGQMFNASDYPSEEEVKDKFMFSFNHEPLPQIDDFRCEIDNDLKKVLQENMESNFNDRISKSIKKLWQKIYKIIKTMHEKLKDENGKFHKTLLGNVQELVNLLPDLNVTNDKALTEMTEKIQNELCIFDIEDLRLNKETRQEAVNVSKNILDTMETFYV